MADDFEGDEDLYALERPQASNHDVEDGDGDDWPNIYTQDANSTQNQNLNDSVDLDDPWAPILAEARAASRGGTPRKFEQLKEFFTYTQTGRRTWDAVCNGCKKSWQDSRNDREIRHIKRCKNISKEKLIKFLEDFIQSGLARGLTLTAKEKAIIDNLIIDLIACQLLPMSIVESGPFIRLLKATNKDYIVMSRWKLPGMITERAESIREHMIENLSRAPPFSLSLEMDGWTSPSSSNVMAITITQRDGSCYLLDLVDLSGERNTADNIIARAIGSIKQAKLSSAALNSIVTDEGSNYRAAREGLRIRFKHHVMIEHRCMAHVFNLMIAAAAKSINLSPILKQLQALIEIIDRRVFLLNHIKSKGGNRLVKMVAVRWYSISQCINSVLAIKPILLQQTPKTAEYHFDKWGPIVDSREFWTKLTLARPYFDRLSSSIGLAEREDSLLSDSFRDLLELIKELIESDDSSSLSMRALFLENTIHYFSKLDIDLLITAYALNPNHNLDWLTDAAITKMKVKILEILRWSDVTINMPKTKEEWQKYLDIIIKRRQDGAEFISDVYEWWVKSKTSFLGLVARRLCCLHASSSNTERIFSGLKQIVRPQRNRLKMSTVNDLMTVRMHVRSQEIKDRRSRSRTSNTEEIEEAILETARLDSDLFEGQETVENLFGVILSSSNFRKFSEYISFERSFISEHAVAQSPQSSQEPREIQHDLDLMRMQAEELSHQF